MKARRIAAAVLAVAMTVGTGTIAVSANEWKVTKTTGSGCCEYAYKNGYDKFKMYTGDNTTLSYAHGANGVTTNWNIDCKSTNTYAQIGFSKPTDKNATWAPGPETLYTSAVATSENGKSKSDLKSNGINAATEIKSKASLGWFETLESASVRAKYHTLAFDLIGTIEQEPEPTVKPTK